MAEILMIHPREKGVYSVACPLLDLVGLHHILKPKDIR